MLANKMASMPGWTALVENGPAMRPRRPSARRVAVGHAALVGREALSLGSRVIAARIVGHRAAGVATRHPIGAGEIAHRVSEIGVGIEQAGRRAGIAHGARSRILDLHQPHRPTAADGARIIAALPNDHAGHQGFGHAVHLGVTGNQRVEPAMRAFARRRQSLRRPRELARRLRLEFLTPNVPARNRISLRLPLIEAAPIDENRHAMPRGTPMMRMRGASPMMMVMAGMFSRERGLREDRNGKR